jgi:hypothetical protein
MQVGNYFYLAPPGFRSKFNIFVLDPRANHRLSPAIQSWLVDAGLRELDTLLQRTNVPIDLEEARSLVPPPLLLHTQFTDQDTEPRPVACARQNHLLHAVFAFSYCVHAASFMRHVPDCPESYLANMPGCSTDGWQLVQSNHFRLLASLFTLETREEVLQELQRWKRVAVEHAKEKDWPVVNWTPFDTSIQALREQWEWAMFNAIWVEQRAELSRLVAHLQPIFVRNYPKRPMLYLGWY